MANTVVNEKVFNVTNEGAQKFVDFKGLDYFWEKAKGYVDTADSALGGRIDTESGRIDELVAIVNELTGNGTEGQGQSIADRINAAIADLKLDETYEKIGVAATKANEAKDAAIEAANGYTDGQVSNMATTLRGEIAEGVQDAKDYADGEIAKAVGTYGSEGVDPSGLRQEIANRDAQVLADAKDYADGLDDEMDARVKVLEGIDHQGIVDAAINDFATKVSNDEVVNTYKELIDYAAEHGAEFTTLVGVVDKKADISYVDGINTELDSRIDVLEAAKDEHAAAITELESKVGNKAEGETEASGIYKIIEENEKTTAEALNDLNTAVADNLAAAKTYADEKANDAKTAAIESANGYTDEKLADYTNTTDMTSAIATAKAEAIADAKAKIDALTEVVNTKASTDYVDQKDADTLAAAKTYASTYTDLLFESITFATEADIDGLFTQTQE